MSTNEFPIPEGLHVIPDHLLDRRPDAEIDQDLLNPKPVTDDEKNLWFFWHNGFAKMYPYGQRTVRSWYRRFSKLGWAIRVLDCEPGSPLNVANYLDVKDINTFPQAFIDGTLSGAHALQHTSDLVRFPLLLKYGGVYSDVGMVPIGDLDRLWNATIGNPESPYEALSYDAGNPSVRTLCNYFLASNKNNPLFLRCHKLFLALWAEDGGKTSTEGMHKSPLLKGAPLADNKLTFEEDGKVYGPEEVGKLLADYIVQGQAMIMAMGLVDDEDNWDGPTYTKNHVYAIDFIVGAQLINALTMWNGPRQFELMSLPLPKPGEAESEDQKQARQVVTEVLQKSFGFKLATGLIIRVMGDTLSSLWRKHTGSDIAPGTYAHWFRHATTYWNQDNIPPTIEVEIKTPIKRGPLLRA